MYILDTSAQGSPLYLLFYSLWTNYIKLHAMWYKSTYNKVSFSTIKSSKNILIDSSEC